jgi:hypothetical protein
MSRWTSFHSKIQTHNFTDLEKVTKLISIHSRVDGRALSRLEVVEPWSSTDLGSDLDCLGYFLTIPSLRRITSYRLGDDGDEEEAEKNDEDERDWETTDTMKTTLTDPAPHCHQKTTTLAQFKN